LSSRESFSTNRASPPSSRDGHSSGPSGKWYEIRAPSTDGGLSNAAVSPTGGDRRELPAVALAWPAENFIVPEHKISSLEKKDLLL